MKCSISIVALLTIMPNAILGSTGDEIMKTFKEQLNVKVERFIFLQLYELHQIKADIKNGLISPDKISVLLTMFKDKPNDLLSLKEYIVENSDDDDDDDDDPNQNLKNFVSAVQVAKGYFQKLETTPEATVNTAEALEYLDALIAMNNAFDAWIKEIDTNSIPGIHEKMGSILVANGIAKALSGLF